MTLNLCNWESQPCHSGEQDAEALQQEEVMLKVSMFSKLESDDHHCKALDRIAKGNDPDWKTAQAMASRRDDVRAAACAF